MQGRERTWRGWRRWLADGGYGGAARGWRFRAALLLFQWRKILLPPFSFVFFFFLSGCRFSVWFWFFDFGFLLLGLFLFFSLSSGRSLSFSLRVSPPSLFGFFFFIYRGSTGGGPWLVRLQSRMAGRFFRWWWWGRGERETREIFSKFFTFCSATNGGEGDDEQCRSKRHRYAFPFFFFFLYMKRRRFE